MPAPSFLKGLPKPILFGLYGAAGGVLGALVFAEPLYRLLTPPPPPVVRPEPEVAVATSPDVTVLVDGRNTFTVRIARAEFDEPVKVWFESLPAGVSIPPLTVPKGATEATATVSAARTASPAAARVRVVAEATAGDKPLRAETALEVAVAEPARPQADVFFVVDVTGSMDWAIAGVRNGIGKFAAEMNRNKIDFRVGLIAFRDKYVDPDWLNLLTFRGEPFTSDVADFRDKVGALSAYGGGDPPESSLEAVEAALKQPFRKSATKVLLLITDVPPKVVNQAGQFDRTLIPEAVRQTATRVKDAGIDSVHLVVNRSELLTYDPLREAGSYKKKGEFFELTDVATGAGFDRLIDDFGRVVTEVAKAKNPEGELKVGGAAKAPELGVRAVQSSQEFAKGTEGRLTLAVGVWTGAIAALVCLALLTGQTHYLGGRFPAAGGALAGLLGGLVVGLVGGAAGQGLYFLAPESAALANLFRVVGWTILGGLAGAGLAFFIPNLKAVHGLAGGAIGGAVGCVGYILVETLAGDLLGRLVGGLILGFCIGVMVAVVEAAFRRAWLEVRFGSRETITVNLGPEPVKVGGDGRACTVWARGAPPLALRYFVRNGQVICEDVPARSEAVVGDGDRREIGNVTLTVRTAMTTAPVPPATTRTAPVTPPRPTPKPDPLPLDDDDGLPLPVPKSAAPKPAPVSPPVAPPVLPKPVPSAPVAGAKPLAPPVPSAPKPTLNPTPAPSASSVPSASKPVVGPRDPDACPGCGRKNPGRPGSRYCMVCDQTY